MRHKIIIPETLFSEAEEHLLQDEKEQLASFLCGISKTDNELTFLCRELIKAGAEDLEYNSPTGVRAKKEYRKRILTRCLEENLHLIDMHSHPFSSEGVDFSHIDDINDFKTLTYILEKFPGIQCGCMVIGPNCLKARTINRDTNSLVPIERITIIGRTFYEVTTANREGDYEAFGRQILLFGTEGQKRLRNTTVGIAGAGGTGSVVFEMLTRLGVGRIIIIDPDHVEISNLNRLVGATPKDVNLPKVDVLKRYAQTYSDTEVEAVCGSILDPSVIEKIKEADAMFGCTDNQSSRMISNETSVKYHLPLIDLGAGILTEKGFIEAGGQVRIVLPDGYCLACINGINYAKAGQELLNQHDRQMRRAAGYVQGHDIPNPSVISLNGTIASLAVTEFLNLRTDIREVNTYITYDMQSNSIVVQTLQAEKDESCPVCGKHGVRGMGDLIPFPNLLEQEPPENIPQTQTKTLEMSE